MKKIESKGFSVVEVIIVILVLGLIGGLGWYIKDRNSSKKTNSSHTANNTPATPKADTSKTEETVVAKEFTSKIGYAITPPKDVIPEELGKGVGAYDSFYLKSSDKAAQKGMIIMNRLADTQTEGTPEGYKGIDIGGRKLETTTVNKLPAVRVADNSELSETYWIYNATKTKVVRVNIVAENQAELTTYKKSLETIHWL